MKAGERRTPGGRARLEPIASPSVTRTELDPISSPPPRAAFVVPQMLASLSLPELKQKPRRTPTFPTLFRKRGNKSPVRQKGWTPVHSAAAKGDLKALRALTSQMSNSRAKTTSGVTPLDVAKHYKQEEVHWHLASLYFRNQRPIVVKVSQKSAVLSWERLHTYLIKRGIKYEVLAQMDGIGEFVPVKLCTQCDVSVTNLLPGTTYRFKTKALAMPSIQVASCTAPLPLTFRDH